MSRFSHQHHHHHRRRFDAWHVAASRSRRPDPARAAPRRTAGRGALARPGPPTAATRALASSASPMRVPWPFFLPGPFPRPWRGPWRVLPILSRFPIWSRARRAAPPAPRTTPAAAPPLRPPPARTPHPGPLRPPPQGKNRANAAAQEDQRKRGELIPAVDVQQYWCDIVSNARSRLLSLPSRIAGVCAGKPQAELEIEARSIVYEVLAELASGGNGTPPA